jgi:hypothetical protein
MLAPEKADQSLANEEENSFAIRRSKDFHRVANKKSHLAEVALISQ